MAGLSVYSWNILFPQPPLGATSERATTVGYYCYPDRDGERNPQAQGDTTLPANRVQKTINIDGREGPVYLGSPNVREPYIERRVQALLAHERVICLQEVVPDVVGRIAEAAAATHRLFFANGGSFRDHGTAILIPSDAELIAGRQIPIVGRLRRFAQAVDLRTTDGRIVTIVSAHLFGKFDGTPADRDVAHVQEVQEILRVARSPVGDQIIIVAADFNTPMSRRVAMSVQSGLFFNNVFNGPGQFYNVGNGRIVASSYDQRVVDIGSTSPMGGILQYEEVCHFSDHPCIRRLFPIELARIPPAVAPAQLGSPVIAEQPAPQAVPPVVQPPVAPALPWPEGVVPPLPVALPVAGPVEPPPVVAIVSPAIAEQPAPQAVPPVVEPPVAPALPWPEEVVPPLPVELIGLPPRVPAERRSLAQRIALLVLALFQGIVGRIAALLRFVVVDPLVRRGILPPPRPLRV